MPKKSKVGRPKLVERIEDKPEYARLVSAVYNKNNTLSKIARYVGKPIPTIDRQLKALVKKGWLDREGDLYVFQKNKLLNSIDEEYKLTRNQKDKFNEYFDLWINIIDHEAQNVTLNSLKHTIAVSIGFSEGIGKFSEMDIPRIMKSPAYKIAFQGLRNINKLRDKPKPRKN